MKTLIELEAEEKRLWEEVKKLEVPYSAKKVEWLAVYGDLRLARLREEVKAELANGKEAV